MSARRLPPGTRLLDVAGHAKPQGSKRHVGNGVMVESSKGLKAWRDQLKVLAQQQRPPHPIAGPVEITLGFRFVRPKSHYFTGRRSDVLREDAPRWATTKNVGDGSKLQRAVEDSLVDACWLADDSLVARWVGEKVWVDRHTGTPGVRITVRELAA